MADDIDADCDDRLRWRPVKPELNFAWLSRLKSLMWPYGEGGPTCDLEDPEVLQRLFVFCRRTGAVSSRELFFAEACHDVRCARLPGRILKENLFKNRRHAMRRDLEKALELIRQLDSGEFAEAKLLKQQAEIARRVQNAKFALHIIETDDPWTHPKPFVPAEPIEPDEVPIEKRYWLTAEQKRMAVLDEERQRKAAAVAAEEARLETTFGAVVDAAPDETLIELLGENALLIRFFNRNGREESMKSLRPYLLRALDQAPAELPY